MARYTAEIFKNYRPKFGFLVLLGPLRNFGPREAFPVSPYIDGPEDNCHIMIHRMRITKQNICKGWPDVLSQYSEVAHLFLNG